MNGAFHVLPSSGPLEVLPGLHHPALLGSRGQEEGARAPRDAERRARSRPREHRVGPRGEAEPSRSRGHRPGPRAETHAFSAMQGAVFPW